jgi:hypothetical protein
MVTDAATVTDAVKSALTLNEPAIDPLIDFEGVTPELVNNFQAWKNAKLAEVLAYLHNNWGLKEVTLDRLVMKPQFVFPDRENRNLYGQVASGQSFTDPEGNVVLHPTTNQPIVFTIWRRVDPPAPPAPPAPPTEDSSPDPNQDIQPVEA